MNRHTLRMSTKRAACLAGKYRLTDSERVLKNPINLPLLMSTIINHRVVSARYQELQGGHIALDQAVEGLTVSKD